MELMKTPIDSLNIPIMMGYNSQDGLIMLIDAVKNKKLEQFDNDFARFIPKSVNLPVDDDRCKILGDKIKQFYLNGPKLCDSTLEGFANLCTDYHFAIFACVGAELHAKYQNRY